jgi:hypothetical protein
MSEIKASCVRCGTQFTAEVPQSVNAAASSDLKEQVRSGELFTRTCPVCGTVNLLKFPFLYYDTDERLMIVLSDAPLAAEGLPEGYTGRLVASVGDLIEKIKIFECGLDDLVIEMCKFVTCRELKKDVPLKFLKSDGSDGEMTFTYPENGQMEMLAVGFNVYEDCRGIIARNPVVAERAKGLAVIDEAWVSSLLR